MDDRVKINVNNGDGEGGVNGGLVYPVMTEEQIQILRHQIVAYTIISEQLVQMYKSSIAQQHFFGMEIGNPSCDPSMALGASKISSRRQRWAPTPVQLQILENFGMRGRLMKNQVMGLDAHQETQLKRSKQIRIAD
ncbi:WUSCHEL-related homeobox 8 [Acorus calamus]|uniref:WUSCHEL-related homeobox 8 n=1 Tax=Acorus calamus TaxID=4465 RepID=A0AAV9DLM7_ACOCL|nr:WUSCHEL-related homeobox 8 [Acorus calamus]